MCIPMNKCCFCFSVDTGTKIISFLSLLWSIFLAAMYGGAAFALTSTPQSKQYFYLLATVAAVLQVIFSCLLIYGACSRRPGYIRPWLVVSWITCVSLVLLSVLGVVLLSQQYPETVEESTDISTMSTLYFVYAVLLYYCTTIVNSRREEIVREDEMESAQRLMRLRDIPKSWLA